MLNWSAIIQGTGYLHAKNYPNEAGYQNDSCSKEAASKINPKLKDLQKRVLKGLQEALGGNTAEGLAKTLSMPPQTVKSRLTELKLLGLIRKSGRKSTTELGGTCHIWEVNACNLT